MTNKEAVSRVLNSLRLLTKDSHISRRFVLRTLRGISKPLIAQKILDRSLQYDYNLYTELKCFEFERVNSVDCDIVSFRRCDILMKSTKKLPELVHSRVGASIKSVTSVDGIYNFTLLDVGQYQRNKKRKYSLEDEVYVYSAPDGHLYIPDVEILAVNVQLISMKPEEVEECSACKKEQCKSNWDAEFICPDRLEETVFRDSIQIVAATTGSIIKDSNPNGIDKTATQ